MIKKVLPTFIFLIISVVLIYAGWRIINPEIKPLLDDVPVFVMLENSEVPTISAIQNITEPVVTGEIETPEEIVGVTVISLPIDENEESDEYNDFEEEPGVFEEIDKIVRKYGEGVSVFYKDIKSGDSYYYNPSKKYFIASIIKAPYAVYIYRRAMEQGLSMDEKLYEYKQSHYWGGTGKIQNMDVGTRFTLGELLAYAIRDSDNIAMNIMMSAFPRSEFTEFARGIGIPHIADVGVIVNGRACAECAAVYIEAIYNFIEEGNEYSEILKEHMMKTINPMIVANYPVVRKYGWAADSFHDIGIIYNQERPYLLAILSDKEGDFAMFREISRAVERYINDKMIEAIEAMNEVEEEEEEIEDDEEFGEENDGM